MVSWRRTIVPYRALIASTAGLAGGVLCSSLVQRRLQVPVLSENLDEDAWCTHCHVVRSAVQKLHPVAARPLRLPAWAFSDVDVRQLFHDDPVVVDVESLNRRIEFIRLGALFTVALGLAGIGGFCYVYFIGIRAPCCAKEMRKAQRAERKSRAAAQREGLSTGRIKGPVEAIL